MKSLFRNLVIFITSFGIAQSSIAQLPSVSSSTQFAMPPGAEFYAGRIEGKPLIKVNLVGGVKVPGVYYVPSDTNLAEMLAYAGGALEGANMEQIQVRSYLGKKWEFKTYNYLELSSSNQPYPLMTQGDYLRIHIERDQLSRSALWISIVSAVTTLIITAINFQKK